MLAPLGELAQDRHVAIASVTHFTKGSGSASTKAIDRPRREVWTGKWPGEDDCERLSFYVNGDPDFPDLNRLFTDCIWDADTQRWERKQ